MDKKSPAVEVAKELAQEVSPEEFTAPYGAVLKIQAVATPLIQDVTSKITDPPVPTWYNKEMERDEPNPNHPDYVTALETAERERGMAVIDALILFGLEVIKPPENDNWIKNLKFMERRGKIDLSPYNLEDEYDKEYLFKRYIVANNDLITRISRKSGVAPEEIKRQEAAFQGNA